MTLDQLLLNRYLYSDYSLQDAVDDGSVPASLTASAQNTTNYGAGATDPGQPIPAPQTGTVISSTIIQSSPSSNRVELDSDDVLRAYNNNVVILTIDKNGITYSDGTHSATFGPNGFIYDGQLQPIQYTGEIDLTTGAITFGPTGWTGARTAPGTYVITHNLNLAAPFMRVFGTQHTTFTGSPFVTQNANSFTFVWESSSGVGVDVFFTFLALRYLP